MVTDSTDTSTNRAFGTTCLSVPETESLIITNTPMSPLPPMNNASENQFNEVCKHKVFLPYCFSMMWKTKFCA